MRPPDEHYPSQAEGANSGADPPVPDPLRGRKPQTERPPGPRLGGLHPVMGGPPLRPRASQARISAPLIRGEPSPKEVGAEGASRTSAVKLSGNKDPDLNGSLDACANSGAAPNLPATPHPPRGCQPQNPHAPNTPSLYP